MSIVNDIEVSDIDTSNIEASEQAYCLHEWIAEQAWYTPDAVALIYEAKFKPDMQEGDENFARTLTYRELDKRSNQLAHYLVKLGVKPGALVGICTERCVEMVIGLLGILKTGAAYVPLDISASPQRVTYIMEQMEMVALLTQQHLQHPYPTSDIMVVCLDRDWPNIGDQPSTFSPSPSLSSSSLAYLIPAFGVMGNRTESRVTHTDVVHFLSNMRDELGLNEDGTLLAVAMLSDHRSVVELFLPLVTGARVVIASDQVAAGAQPLADLLARSGAALIQVIPSVLTGLQKESD